MDGTVGEIRLFAGKDIPKNWAPCHGQTLQISNYESLFAVVGSTYGGDGEKNFKLPDLRGRVPVGVGKGSDFDQIKLGQTGGKEQNRLTPPQLPPHTHGATATSKLQITVNEEQGNQINPKDNYLAKNYFQESRETTHDVRAYHSSSGNSTLNNDSISGSIEVTIGQTGKSEPIPNRQPYQGLNYIICFRGHYPSAQKDQ
ncbi:phage tail protein [Fodinibius sp. Rm-B-1B1-1]|uniref:phage tail protein n=1 Tax=Fodinibius alkaliphilus TaxID=3140241 RepID=UPI00315A1752